MAVCSFYCSCSDTFVWPGFIQTAQNHFIDLLHFSGLRYLEAFFGFLLAIMSGMFGFLVSYLNLSSVYNDYRNYFSFQYFHHLPNQVHVLEGFVPFYNGTHSYSYSHSTQPGLELVGSILMPHNIYLHSGLVLVS